jgi:ABC-2 type transport system permease protein
MRAALVIAAKDLRQRLRDRTAIIVAVIAPFGLAAIFSLLLGGTDAPVSFTYAYVDADGSEISAALETGALASLEEAGIATIVEADSADAARQAVDNDEVDAALIVPAGFGDAVTSGGGAELEIVGATDAGFATQVLDAVANGSLTEIDAIRLSVATTVDALGPPDAPAGFAELAARAAETSSPIAIEPIEVDLAQMSSTTFYAASMAIFFLFFTAQFGVLSLLTERRVGTLPRLVAAPIGPWAIVLGKALGSFALGIVAMTVLVVASTFLLGAEWGDPVAVALLVLGAVTAAMGITALITTLARTEEQAGGWNSIVAVTMAILGGAFFDLSQGPEILGVVSVITPHAWFLGGLDILAVPSAGVADVAVPVAALFGIGIVTGAIGLIRARGLVVQR